MKIPLKLIAFAGLMVCSTLSYATEMPAQTTPKKGTIIVNNSGQELAIFIATASRNAYLARIVPGSTEVIGFKKAFMYHMLWQSPHTKFYDINYVLDIRIYGINYVLDRLPSYEVNNEEAFLFRFEIDKNAKNRLPSLTIDISNYTEDELERLIIIVNDDFSYQTVLVPAQTQETKKTEAAKKDAATSAACTIL